MHRRASPSRVRAGTGSDPTPIGNRAEHRSPPHLPGLDGLRAIAVLLVLYNHAPQLLGDNDGSDGWFFRGSPGAWIGVDIFFVLSGFLITNLLLHGSGRPGALGRFWWRRALRIFPLALLYLAVAAAFGQFVPGFAHLGIGTDYAWAASYLINLHIALHGWTAAALGILWSLAIEEQFYCVWPLAVLRCGKRTLVTALIALLAATPLLRAWLLPSIGPTGIYVLTCCRFDTLAAGALLAMLWRSPAQPLLQRATAWLTLPAIAWLAWVVFAPVPAASPLAPPWFLVVGYSGVAAAAAVVCAMAIAPPAWLHRWLCHRWLAAIGRISYGLYVWHVLTAEAVAHTFARLWPSAGLPLRAFTWLGVLFLTATLSYRLYEAPLLRWKDRVTPRPLPTPKPSGAPAKAAAKALLVDDPVHSE